MIASVLGPALPTLADNVGTGLAQMGFLFTARSFGYLLGSLFAGRTYDRLPGNRLLALMIVGCSLGMGLTPLIPRLWLLALVLLALGLCEGGLDIGANLLLVWLHGARANPFLNGLHFFFGLGALLSPIIVAQALLRTTGVTAAFWLLALYPLPVALGLLRLPSPAAPHRARVHPAERLPDVRVNWLLVVLISLIFMLYVGAEVSFGGWVYSYALVVGVGDVASAAYLTSAFWGALMMGRLLSVPLATRVRPAGILFIDLLGCLASLGIILVFPAGWAVWAGAIGLGLAMASFFPSLLAFANAAMPSTGETTRWFFVGTGAGGMVLPWLVGVLAGRFGPRTTMPTILLDLALALVLYGGCWWLARGAREAVTVSFEITNPQ